MKTTILVSAFGLLLAVGATRTASAQPADNQEEAQADFQKGETALNLGRYDEAADWYTKAYEAWPAPEFLYNIAQANRLGGKCKEALHFYKRFKKLKEKDTDAPLSEKKLAKINEFIDSLEKCVKEQDEAAAKQPEETDDPNHKNPDDTEVKPDEVKPDEVADADDGEDEDEDEDGIDDSTVLGAKMVSAHAGLGLALVAVGPQDVPVQGSFFLSAGYPLPVGPVILDAGIGIGYTPLPYRTTMDVGEMASLTSFLANAGATYPINDKIGVRGELGLGLQTFGNLAAGNPFTEGGRPTDGTLGLFNVRFAVAAEYAITPNIAASVTPLAVSLSPKKEGLQSGVTSIDFMVGVGYRM